MRQLIHTTLRPAMYHGHGKRPPFFEGWYYKLVSADETRRYAIIPGVILGPEGHAFIQVLNGVSGRSTYHVYPLSEFWASFEDFEVRVGPNYFARDRLLLQVETDQGRVFGDLRFTHLTPWPVSLLSPGIMGWYAWMPRMECYHGVVSLNHNIQGSMEIDDQPVNFSGGTGYIEKDWGQSFPAAWVWFQSNHFLSPQTCITASVAIIPWVGRAFPGFIVGFWHNQLLYRFATYTGAQIQHLQIEDDHVHWIVRDRRHRLEMTAGRAEGGLLLGPTRVDMGKRVVETLNATVDLSLSTISGGTIYSGRGHHAGLEVHGDLDGLRAMVAVNTPTSESGSRPCRSDGQSRG